MKIKFKAIRFLPNRSQLSFFAKWLTKEVTAGLVVAAAIALATLWINNYQARQKEKLQLEKLHLGLSSQYIVILRKIHSTTFGRFKVLILHS